MTSKSLELESARVELPCLCFLKIFANLHCLDTWKKLKCEAHIAKPSQRDATSPVQNRSVTSQYRARKLMLSYTPTPSPPASHSQGGVNCNPLWACAQLSLITPRWPPAALLGRAANILRFCTRSDFAPRPRPRRRRPVLNLNWIAT